MKTEDLALLALFFCGLQVAGWLLLRLAKKAQACLKRRIAENHWWDRRIDAERSMAYKVESLFCYKDGLTDPRYMKELKDARDKWNEILNQRP